jgi:N-methylhydantoinase A
MQAIYHELQREIAAELKKENWRGRVVYEPSADLRYRGQGYEINIPYSPGLFSRFHAEHQRRYGYQSPAHEVEIVTVRLRGRVASPEKLGLMKSESSREKGTAVTANVYFGVRQTPTLVLPRGVLKPGRRYRGPAIITEYSATTVVPPGFIFQADKADNLLVEVG